MGNLYKPKLYKPLYEPIGRDCETSNTEGETLIRRVQRKLSGKRTDCVTALWKVPRTPTE